MDVPIALYKYPSSFPLELAKVNITLGGFGKITGFSIREKKDKSATFLASPSIYSETKGWQKIITLNGALNEEIHSRIEQMQMGETLHFTFTISECVMAVYVSPYDGSNGLIAMGSITVKNLLSVNRCTYRLIDGKPVMEMPKWKNDKGTYFFLDKSLYWKIQDEAKVAYALKAGHVPGLATA